MAIADWEAVRSDWSRLQAFYAQTRGEAANATIAEESWSGVNQMFSLASRNIRRLSETGDYGAGVISGKVSRAEWAQLANATAGTLKEVLAVFGEEDLYARAWNEIIVPTAIEARETAQAALSGGTSILTLVVIGLALVVVLKVVR